MYYASFGLLAIVMHVIVNADTLFTTPAGTDSVSRGRYRSFLYGVMLYYITDILWGILYEAAIVPIVYLDTFIYFVSMGLSLLLWIRFIIAYLNKDNKWSTILHYVGWILFGLELLALIINCFVPLMFAFREDGEYLPGQARYVILVVQIVIFALIAVYTLYHAFTTRNRERLHFSAIGISGLIMALFIALQALYPLLPFYAIGCLLATSIINTYVNVDERIANAHQLGSMKKVAYKDSLTNVRNATAYAEAKKAIDKDAKNNMVTEYGVVVCDLNDLKTINDTKGHEAGDRYIQDGCKLICTVFKHSPVFRVGGDEFVAILKNDDFQFRDDLMELFNSQVDTNLSEGGVVVASGIGVYDPSEDRCFDDVFNRADQMMYNRKRELKGII